MSSYRRQRKHRMNYWDRSCLEMLEATSEAFRINVDQVFQKLISNPEMEEYSFPPTLNNFERKFIHEKCRSFNLISRSKGKEPNRHITVYKRVNKSNFESFFIDLCPRSRYELKKLKELNEIVEQTQITTSLNWREKTFGKLLMCEPAFVHEINVKPEIQRFQRQLPVYEKRNEIIEKIRNNRVTIVTSETGSGKTTQIPQYILDDARHRNEKCRIICTQPRRISAVSVAERVAYERGTKLGDAIGYHIRLESKYGSKCNLIYCTNGVLIRTLLSGRHVYNTFTHIIIDEVHERDKLSDFLLICLREMLRRNNNFKLILMSATIDIEKFQNYFNEPVVLRIPGRLYPINQLFLNDILKMLNYVDTLSDPNGLLETDNQADNACYNQQYDEIIIRCFQSNDQHELDEIWSQIFVYLLNENMPVNYQNSTSGSTILMAAILQENYDMIERLLHLGADPRLRMKDGCDCLQLSQNNEEILTMLTMKLSTLATGEDDIIGSYYKKFDDQEINYDLLSKLIKLIHEQYQSGAILVFLPGYDDIMICYEYIYKDLKLSPLSYCVYLLHGSMNIKEQHDVFKPSDIRKIILSTNIAETSVTIDDVVYVIDSGKAKVQTYDSCNGLSSLQTQWISKACVKQRAGRAGRTKSGICFHLFSELRYKSLLDHRIPEILRVPLEELCLNTKTLDMKFSSIYNFLSLALDPPSSQSVKNAVENLQCLGALDENENLTPLGEYLSQLTIEPHLGKILIYSVIFKCLDPVLTIVASMAQKDPFQLPPQAYLRSSAAAKRRNLMEDTGSDHMTYLNAFIKWQESVVRNKERNFCRDYFISSSTMELILKTRNQLNKQLRAAKFLTNFDSSLVDCNQMSDNWALIKAVLSAGLYPKLAFKKGGVYCTRSEKKVIPHSSNSLNRNDITLWLVYDDMVNIRSIYHLRGITPITPITISLMCGVKAISNQANHLTIDDWLEFEFPDSTILHLRRYIDTIIEKKLLCATNPLTRNDKFALRIVANILQAEEQTIDMPLPRDIKLKPAFFELQRGYNNAGYNKIDLTFNYRLNKNDEAANNQSPANTVLLSNRITDHIASKHLYNPQQQQQQQSVNNLCEVSGNALHMLNGASSVCNNSLSILSTKVQSFPVNVGTDDSSSKRNKSVFLLIHADAPGAIKIAYRTNNFVFGPASEGKIRDFEKSGYEIYLFFTIYRLKIFYGIAQFAGFNDTDNGLLATLDWKMKKILYYDSVSHLRNPSNHNVAIFDGNDGQIIDMDVALILWKIYDRHGVESEF